MRLSLLMPHLNFFCQKTLQFLGTQEQIKLPFVGYRNRACFFRYNDRMGIRHLRYSHRRTMPQTQFFRNIQIVRHGQDTSCRLNALLADNHSSVVQRAVLGSPAMRNEKYPILFVLNLYNFVRGKRENRTTELHSKELHPFLQHQYKCRLDPSPTGRLKPSVPTLTDIITII